MNHTEGGATAVQGRSTAFTVAWRGKKRRGLRSVLSQFQMNFEYYGSPIDHSRVILNNLKGREVELELLDV